MYRACSGAVLLLMMAALAVFTCQLRLYIDALFLAGALFFAFGAWAAAGLSGATMIAKRLGYCSEEHAKTDAQLRPCEVMGELRLMVLGGIIVALAVLICEHFL